MVASFGGSGGTVAATESSLLHSASGSGAVRNKQKHQHYHHHHNAQSQNRNHQEVAAAGAAAPGAEESRWLCCRPTEAKKHGSTCGFKCRPLSVLGPILNASGMLGVTMDMVKIIFMDIRVSNGHASLIAGIHSA